jgi:hypothetical protein
MANRLNDTDPQSPRAFGSRTDPGLGEPPPLVGTAGAEASPIPLPAMPATPSPGSTSIEELLDGITGPRPPSSRPQRQSRPRPVEAAPDAARAYAPARQAPASQPMPPAEPAVLTPEPPLYSGAGGASRELTVPRKVEPESTPPVVRRPGDERTVHTGRRAVVRNFAAVTASSLAVALMMVTIMRWKEAHSHGVPAPSDVAALPAATADNVHPAPVSAGAQVAAVPVVAPPPTDVVPAAAATSGASVVTPVVQVAKPAGSAQKRPKAGGGAKGTAAPAAPADALDDLNRQIRH